MAGEHWKDKPEAQDFPAAKSHLSLLVGSSAGAQLARALRKTKTLKHHAAKDILRAAGLAMLDPDDTEVAADLEKVKKARNSRPCCSSGEAHCGWRTATTESAPATTWRSA